MMVSVYSGILRWQIMSVLVYWVVTVRGVKWWNGFWNSCEASTESEVDDCAASKYFTASTTTHERRQFQYSTSTCRHVSTSWSKVSELACQPHSVSATLVVISGRTPTAASRRQEARGGECRGGSQQDAVVDGRRAGRRCRSDDRHRCDGADAGVRRLSLPTPAAYLASTPPPACCRL